MADLASVDDLARLMKRAFSGSDLDQAEMVVATVSAWARAVSGQIWPNAPTGVPSDVMYVVLSASRRTLRNPDGVVSEAMGPFSKSYDKPPADFFSPAEIAILKRYRAKGNNGLFTVGFSRGEVGNEKYLGHLFFNRHDRDDISGDPFPCYWPNDPGFEESWHFDD
jgi:hypothetical protein